ncbi:hypothetical protein FUAX_19390 [Fulvitalea axinellae]|uniref:BRCT domain-containing protein n=1 Tax=Fulvitalea axinellae TaxID=1182444 RepID=A0AAU9CNH7_9BACT|nr:hypothetical protein FUAX_19390 [Fulvitalea axinellae]
MKAYFEYIDIYRRQYKFWSAKIEPSQEDAPDLSITIKHGQIGSEGEKRRARGDMKFFEKLIQEECRDNHYSQVYFHPTERYPAHKGELSEAYQNGIFSPATKVTDLVKEIKTNGWTQERFDQVMALYLDTNVLANEEYEQLKILIWDNEGEALEHIIESKRYAFTYFCCYAGSPFRKWYINNYLNDNESIKGFLESEYYPYELAIRDCYLFSSDSKRQYYLESGKDGETPPEYRILFFRYPHHLTVKSLPIEFQAFSEAKGLNLSGYSFENFPSVLFQLEKLEELQLCYSALSSIPEDISKCKSLKTLDLRNSKIETLPGSISAIESLEKVLLDQTPIEKIPVNQFLKDMREKKMPNDHRKIFFSLLFNPLSPETSNECRDILFEALKSKFALIRNNAILSMEPLFGNANTPKPGDSVLIAGSFANKTEKKKDLKEKGYIVKSKVDSSLDYILVGEKPGRIGIAGFKGKLINGLRFFESINNSFLQEASEMGEHMRQQIQTLLDSSDETNHILAFNILKNEGVIKEFFTEIFLVTFSSNNDEVRKVGRTLIKEHASPALKKNMGNKRINFIPYRNEKDLQKMVDICGGTELDIAKLIMGSISLKRQRLYYRPTPAYALKYILKYGNKEQIELLLNQVQEDDFDNIEFPLPEPRYTQRLLETLQAMPEIKEISFWGSFSDFENALPYLQHIEKFEIRAFDSDTKVVTIPETIRYMQKLKRLIFSNVFNRSDMIISDNIKQLKQLEILVALNYNEIELSECILEMDNLKICLIENMEKLKNTSNALKQSNKLKTEEEYQEIIKTKNISSRDFFMGMIF